MVDTNPGFSQTVGQLGRAANLKIFAKFYIFLIPALAATTALAQQTSQDNQGAFNPVSLASEFFEHDFVNFYAFADGVYDSYAPSLQNSGQTSNTGGFGWDAGGGVSAYHAFHDSSLSLSYRGAYRDYRSTLFASGTDQDLSLSYVKRLNRRWSISFSEAAAIFLYGGTYFSVEPSQTGIVPNNPFAPETKFLASSVGLSYQQTRRLSYSFGGSFFLQRYNYPQAVGTTGGSGSVSVFYRITSRSTVGGTYSHAYYGYQRNAGQAQVDSAYASITHQFHRHWTASFSGGITRSNISGTALVPVTLQLPGGGTVGGYTVGPYSQIAHFPSFSGSVSRAFRKWQVSGSAGQGVVSGNGYFLASKDQYLNGVFSYSWRRSNFSAGGGFFRLSSVANSVSSSYSSGSFSASYGVVLHRYFGTSLRYDYVHYGNLNPYAGIADNRLSFGVTFSSKSIPLTLY